MATEIERNPKMRNNPPNPMEVLQGVAVMQAVTLGFLIGSQFMMSRRLRLLALERVVINVSKVAE